MVFKLACIQSDRYQKRTGLDVEVVRGSPGLRQLRTSLSLWNILQSSRVCMKQAMLGLGQCSTLNKEHMDLMRSWIGREDGIGK